jgi:cell wall-associated NlpC family hydrolase
MPCQTAERAAVIGCARAWLRTPYHHRGRVKGAGVDCAMLLAEVYAEAGLVRHLAIPHYPPDWHLHRDAERYLGVLLDHAVEYLPDFARADHPHPDPLRGREREGGALPTRPILPADIALWRFGRCFSHGAIVVDWPIVIHAYLGRGCVLEDAAKAEWLSRIGEGRDAQPKPRPVKFFTLARWVDSSLRAPAGSEAIRVAGSLRCARDDVEHP